jgi:cell wall-associated NlpC family hydrolase
LTEFVKFKEFKAICSETIYFSNFMNPLPDSVKFDKRIENQLSIVNKLLTPGDILYRRTRGHFAFHAGLYLGEGRIAHVFV